MDMDSWYGHRLMVNTLTHVVVLVAGHELSKKNKLCVDGIKRTRTFPLMSYWAGVITRKGTRPP